MSYLFSSPLGIPLYVAMVVFFLAWIGHRATPRRLRVPIRQWRVQKIWDNLVRGCRVLTTAGDRRDDARERFRDDRL